MKFHKKRTMIRSANADSDDIPVERETQINSIIKTLQESFEKLKISLILPQILENHLKLQQRLGDSQYMYCIKLIEQYIKDKKIGRENKNLQPHLNYRLIRVIDFFQENFHCLEYFSDWVNDLSAPEKSIIESFQLLQTISELRLKKSATAELNKEKRIHKIYYENENLKKNIKVLEALIKNRCITSKWKAAFNETMIRKYEQELTELKYENNIRIKTEIINSTQAIKQIRLSSVAKRKELEEELERSQLKYDRLLKGNLKDQKNARDEKNKLLLQLQALIKRFDDTMSEKFKENLYLKDEHERKKQELDDFMIVYNKEEKEYARIVLAKEEEERQQQEEKILLFMMNRAARVIQKYWRKFRRAQKRAAKKGKGRGKGKKK